MSDFHFASRVVRFEIVIVRGDSRFDSEDGKAPGGFCCFSVAKSREKSFLCTFGAKSTKSLRTSFSAGVCDPRRCTGRARSSLCATPWRTRRSPHPLFPRQTRVRIGGAANGGIVYFTWQCASEARINLLVLPASGCVSLLFRKTNHPRNSIFSFSARRFPTWSRWRKSGRRAESASGGDGLLANPRIVARRRFQPFGRRHRNRSGGFCCFSPPKSREKSFPELYAESSVFTNFFLLVLLGPKVPKASARRFPRECASRGAARGAQDQAYAPPRGGRAAARTLFFRVKRECGLVVPPTAALFILHGNAPRKPVSTYLSCPPPAACHFCFAKPTTLATPFFLFPQGDSRLGPDGERADGGLKARAAGTVCLQTRE